MVWMQCFASFPDQGNLQNSPLLAKTHTQMFVYYTLFIIAKKVKTDQGSSVDEMIIKM